MVSAYYLLSHQSTNKVLSSPRFRSASMFPISGFYNWLKVLLYWLDLLLDAASTREALLASPLTDWWATLPEPSPIAVTTDIWDLPSGRTLHPMPCRVVSSSTLTVDRPSTRTNILLSYSCFSSNICLLQPWLYLPQCCSLLMAHRQSLVVATRVDDCQLMSRCSRFYSFKRIST